MSWTHEEYLAAVLSREAAAREASGAEMLEDFSFDHQPGLKRDTIPRLARDAFLTGASIIVLLEPPEKRYSRPPSTGSRGSRQPTRTDDCWSCSCWAATG